MGARVTIDQPAPHQIQLVLRQDSAEVARFMLFVLVITGALLLLVPQARSSPVPCLGWWARRSGGAWLRAQPVRSTSLTVQLGPSAYSSSRC
jgi:hypothetical protein